MYKSVMNANYFISAPMSFPNVLQQGTLQLSIIYLDFTTV